MHGPDSDHHHIQQNPRVNILGFFRPALPTQPLPKEGTKHCVNKSGR